MHGYYQEKLDAYHFDPDSDLKNRVGVEFQKSSDANHLL